MSKQLINTYCLKYSKFEMIIFYTNFYLIKTDKHLLKFLTLLNKYMYTYIVTDFWKKKGYNKTF